MYRLMKSEKFTLDDLTSGLMSFYRQTQVECFQRFRSALGACEVANNSGRSRYYLLNESGQEYYGTTAAPGSTDLASLRPAHGPRLSGPGPLGVASRRKLPGSGPDLFGEGVRKLSSRRSAEGSTAADRPTAHVPLRSDPELPSDHVEGCQQLVHRGLQEAGALVAGPIVDEDASVLPGDQAVGEHDVGEEAIGLVGQLRP